MKTADNLKIIESGKSEHITHTIFIHDIQKNTKWFIQFSKTNGRWDSNCVKEVINTNLFEKQTPQYRNDVYDFAFKSIPENIVSAPTIEEDKKEETDTEEDIIQKWTLHLQTSAIDEEDVLREFLKDIKALPSPSIPKIPLSEISEEDMLEVSKLLNVSRPDFAKEVFNIFKNDTLDSPKAFTSLAIKAYKYLESRNYELKNF